MVEIMLAILGCVTLLGLAGLLLTVGLLPLSIMFYWLSPQDDPEEIQRLLDQ